MLHESSNSSAFGGIVLWVNKWRWHFMFPAWEDPACWILSSFMLLYSFQILFQVWMVELWLKWSNISSYCEFCRSKLIHMENRETVVLAVALLCMLVAPLCYLIAKCIPRTQNDSWSGSCSPADQSSLGKQPKQHEKCRSSGFPYLLLSMTSAFIIWVLSV